MQVIEIRATTDLDDDFQPIQTPLAGDGSTEVLSTTSFVVRFDRFVLPMSVVRQSICIQSDVSANVQAIEDCKSPVFLEPTYNPVRREVLFRQSPDADKTRLAPGTRYALTVLAPPSEDAATGFRAFDGAPLSQTKRIEFATVAQDPSQATLEVPPTGDLYCRREPECLSTCADDACRAGCEKIGVEPLITGCAFGAACHSDAVGSGGDILRGAAEGLNFSTSEFILATAVNRVAHQTMMGGHADEPDRSPLRFGRAMPILDAGNPGNSYALYKLVIGPNVADDAASAEEIARLKASVVVGLAMPPLTTASFNAAQADLLSAWIAQGAVPRDCSLPPFD